MINSMEHFDEVAVWWNMIKEAFRETNQANLLRHLDWHITSDGTGSHQEQYYRFSFKGLGIDGYVSVQVAIPHKRVEHHYHICVLGQQMRSNAFTPLKRLVADFSEFARDAISSKAKSLSKHESRWTAYAVEAKGMSDAD